MMNTPKTMHNREISGHQNAWRDEGESITGTGSIGTVTYLSMETK